MRTLFIFFILLTLLHIANSAERIARHIAPEMFEICPTVCIETYPPKN